MTGCVQLHIVISITEHSYIYAPMTTHCGRWGLSKSRVPPGCIQLLFSATTSVNLASHSMLLCCKESVKLFDISPFTYLSSKSMHAGFLSKIYLDLRRYDNKYNTCAYQPRANMNTIPYGEKQRITLLQKVKSPVYMLSQMVCRLFHPKQLVA